MSRVRESRFGREFGLWTLTVVLLINFMDRKVLIILQEAVKRDLGLSDTQLGLLNGLAFSFVYAVAGLPLARLADATNRKWLIICVLTIWSLLTCLCGLATSFTALLILRLGVAVGEAGSTPATHSIISDLYPPAERVAAFGRWALGVPIGTMLGYAVGGWLESNLGWRMTMLVVGLLSLATLPLLLAFREPVRGRFDDPAKAGLAMPPVTVVIREIWANPPLRYLFLGASLTAFLSNAVLVWSAPFYIRQFGMALSDIALCLALGAGLSGGVGMWGGSYIARSLTRQDMRGAMWVPALSSLLLALLLPIEFLSPHLGIALAAGALVMLLLAVPLPCYLATAQSLVLPNVRAQVGSALMLCTALLGAGLGPLLIGMMSDLVPATAQTTSLRYALVSITPLAAIAAWAYFASSRRIAPVQSAMSG